MSPVYSYALGAGHNLPLGSLVNIETIVPGSSVAFYPPSAYGAFNPGEFIIRQDDLIYQSGFPVCQWAWVGNPQGKMTWEQARYLQDTYCNGGYSGFVTIYTQTDDPGMYQRFNATMKLTKLTDAGRNFTNFGQYTITFTQLVYLPEP